MKKKNKKVLKEVRNIVVFGLTAGVMIALIGGTAFLVWELVYTLVNQVIMHFFPTAEISSFNFQNILISFVVIILIAWISFGRIRRGVED